MPLIVELSSSSSEKDINNEEDKEDEGDVADAVFLATETALNRLVEYYRQPVHIHASPRDDSKNQAVPVVLQSLVRMVLNSYQDHTQHSNFKINAEGRLILHLLEGYQTKIRPVLFSAEQPRIVQECGVAVVVHYERFVSQILAQAFQNVGSSNALDTELQKIPAEVHPTPLAILVRDVTAVQSHANQKHTAVLSTLLRLIYHTFGVMDLQKCETGILRQCLTVLFAFQAPRCHVEMDHRIPEQLLDLSLYMDPLVVDDSQAADYKMSESILETVGLTVAAADSQSTVKHSDAAGRVVDEILQRWSDAADSTLTPAALDNKDQSSLLLDQLGAASMVEVIRAHFFGRDADVLQDGSLVKPRLHLGHTVTHIKKTENPDIPPYQSNESRLRATLTYLCLLKNVDESIWEGILPVIYELLSSGRDESVRWGAVCLFHLLQCSGGGGDDDSGGRGARLALSDVATDNLFSMLSTAVRICRVGGTLAVLGLAQRHLQMRVFPKDPRNTDPMILRRRQFTQQWLLLLDKNNRHITQDYLVWGLLMGGITSLLFDHARCGENADALDLGRLGLSALLPVLRGECGFCDVGDSDDTMDSVEATLLFTGSRGVSTACALSKSQRQAISLAVQVAALTALSNLLVAAHPIMPRHAGKLMCELVAYTRRHTHHTLIRPLALEVAARALVVGGGPAVKVLDHIVASDAYYDKILETIEMIRTTASEHYGKR